MSESQTEVSIERVEKYLDITHRARAKATPIHAEGSPEARQLAVMMRMADDYASDALHFTCSTFRNFFYKTNMFRNLKFC